VQTHGGDFRDAGARAGRSRGIDGNACEIASRVPPDALAIRGSAEIASIAANQNNRRWILCFIGPPFALVLNV